MKKETILILAILIHFSIHADAVWSEDPTNQAPAAPVSFEEVSDKPSRRPNSTPFFLKAPGRFAVRALLGLQEEEKEVITRKYVPDRALGRYFPESAWQIDPGQSVLTVEGAQREAYTLKISLDEPARLEDYPCFIFAWSQLHRLNNPTVKLDFHVDTDADGLPDSRAAAVWGLKLQKHLARQELTLLQSIDMTGVEYQPKSNGYRVRRELGLKPGSAWQYGRDGARTILQQRFDRGVREAEVLKLAFKPDAHFVRVNLWIDTDGNRKRDFLILYDDNVNYTDKKICGEDLIIEFDLLEVVKQQGLDPDKVRLAELIVWLDDDIGRVQKEGLVNKIEFYAKKELVIRNGSAVQLTAVDRALLSHPDVSEAVSFGVFEEGHGEDVYAVLKLKPGRSKTPQDFLVHYRKELSQDLCPGKVFVAETLPDTAHRKSLRKVLLEKYHRPLRKELRVQPNVTRSGSLKYYARFDLEKTFKQAGIDEGSVTGVEIGYLFQGDLAQKITVRELAFFDKGQRSVPAALSIPLKKLDEIAEWEIAPFHYVHQVDLLWSETFSAASYETLVGQKGQGFVLPGGATGARKEGRVVLEKEIDKKVEGEVYFRCRNDTRGVGKNLVLSFEDSQGRKNKTAITFIENDFVSVGLPAGSTLKQVDLVLEPAVPSPDAVSVIPLELQMISVKAEELREDRIDLQGMTWVEREVNTLLGLDSKWDDPGGKTFAVNPGQSRQFQYVIATDSAGIRVDDETVLILPYQMIGSAACSGSVQLGSRTVPFKLWAGKGEVPVPLGLERFPEKISVTLMCTNENKDHLFLTMFRPFLKTGFVRDSLDDRLRRARLIELDGRRVPVSGTLQNVLQGKWVDFSRVEADQGRQEMVYIADPLFYVKSALLVSDSAEAAGREAARQSLPETGFQTYLLVKRLAVRALKIVFLLGILFCICKASGRLKKAAAALCSKIKQFYGVASEKNWIRFWLLASGGLYAFGLTQYASRGENYAFTLGGMALVAAYAHIMRIHLTEIRARYPRLTAGFLSTRGGLFLLRRSPLFAVPRWLPPYT